MPDISTNDRWDQDKLTFQPLIPSFALRTRLVPIFSLVFITRPTNREGTLIASDKDVTRSCKSNSIATNLTYLAIQML